MKLDAQQTRILDASARRYWWKVLYRDAALEAEDAVQEMRLQAFLTSKPQPSLRRFAAWNLYRRFIDHNNHRCDEKRALKQAQRLVLIGRSNDARSMAQAMAHNRALAFSAASWVSTITDEQREYLYQNLWAVGLASSYAHLQAYLEGASSRGTHSDGWDSTSVRRQLVVIRKAFPTQASLLSDTPAAELGRHAAINVVTHALATGRLDRLPVAAGLTPSRRRVARARLADYDTFTEEHKAFLERQLR